MFKKRDWEIALIAKVVDPEGVKRAKARHGWVPEDGSKRIITVNARTRFGAIRKALIHARLLSMCFLGMPIVYDIDPRSIKPL